MISVNVNNFMMTQKEASDKKCPYLLGKQGYPRNCSPDGCMSWIEARKEIAREDHSGAREVIQGEARARGGQEIKREGPSGSLGVLMLEAQGFCMRLWKETL